MKKKVRFESILSLLLLLVNTFIKIRKRHC
jgi:hypothetical protein